MDTRQVDKPSSNEVCPKCMLHTSCAQCTFSSQFLSECLPKQSAGSKRATSSVGKAKLAAALRTSQSYVSGLQGFTALVRGTEGASRRLNALGFETASYQGKRCPQGCSHWTVAHDFAATALVFESLLVLRNDIRHVK